MFREDYLPDRKGITTVNLLVTRHDDDRLTVRLSWIENGVHEDAEVSHRMGVPLATACTWARDAIWQREFWHTTIADVFGTLAGEDRGLSVER